MSQAIVERVNQQFPVLLQQNINATCYQFVVHVIAALRAAGHQAFHVCKSPGEGQYTPPGFAPRTVIGLDGKEYRCSGVSHDALWCDGAIFDTVGNGNDAARPIYRRQGDPNWSFDPADGPQIVGTPVWNPVPPHDWRPNNPPLKDGAPTPNPPQPPAVTMPSYEELGGDAYWRDELGKTLQADMEQAGPAHGGGPLNDGSVVWFSQPIYLILEAYAKGQTPDRPAIIKSVRNEWRAILGLPPVP